MWGTLQVLNGERHELRDARKVLYLELAREQRAHLAFRWHNCKPRENSRQPPPFKAQLTSGGGRYSV